MQHAPSVPCLLQSNRNTIPPKRRADNERRVTVNVVAAPVLCLPPSPQLSCASPLSASPLHSLLPTPTGSPYSTPRGRGPYSPCTSPIPLRPGHAGFMSRSADQLPGAPLPFPSLLTRPQSPSKPSCQGAVKSGEQGQGFDVQDFPLGIMVFDPSNASLRAQLLAALGAPPQSTFEAMRGFHGGMNEGVAPKLESRRIAIVRAATFVVFLSVLLLRYTADSWNSSGIWFVKGGGHQQFIPNALHCAALVELLCTTA